MDLLNNTDLDNKVKKNDIETVVKEKMEYTLLGTYIIKSGLKLFSYNPSNGKTALVEIKKGNIMSTMRVKSCTDNAWYYWDEETNKATIDSRLEYFQALRLESAKKRVTKYKQGAIKELFNLKKPNPDGIDIFKHI